MTTWHAEPSALSRYRNGEVPDSIAFSIEAHLPSCKSCREALSALVPGSNTQTVWDDIVAELDAPRPGLAERCLSTLGLPTHISRLVMATPSLRLSTGLAMFLAATFALLASTSAGEASRQFAFLVLAPVVPVLAIAAAFTGPRPAAEIDRATPLGGIGLVLLRSIPVLVVSLAAVAVAAQFGSRGWSADARWILPSLALSIGTLALSSFAPIGIAGAGLTGIWLFGAAAGTQWRPLRIGLDAETFVAFQPVGQLCALGVALFFCLVLAVRHHAFDLRRI